MVFRSPYFKCDFLNHHIEVNGTRLTRVGKHCPEQSVKFLGVIMDNLFILETSYFQYQEQGI